MNTVRTHPAARRSSMSGKPVISAKRIYDVIVTLDHEGGGTYELDEMELRALKKARRLQYIDPAQYAPTSSGRAYITRYRITADGRDFIHRVDDQAEVENGGPL
jgi:hypothetical protein